MRRREAFAAMEAEGIRVVTPTGAQMWADLPIIVPEIKGMLHGSPEKLSIFDVGGDDVGARVMASFREHLADEPYQLLQVINSRRPFTDTVAGCLKMMNAIEGMSRLSVTGFIANSHLVTETTADVILEGYRLAGELAARSGRPLELVTAMGDLADDPRVAGLDVPVLRLERIMLPPWLRREAKNDSAGTVPNPVPAARNKPIGRP